MGCCLPSRVAAAGGGGYTPIVDPAAATVGASSSTLLRAGRWSPISYGKKTWAVAADGTLSRPAAYVHPALWQMMADAEQDDKAWKKARRKYGASMREIVESDGRDDGWWSGEDCEPLVRGQRDRAPIAQTAPVALSIADEVPPHELSAAEAAPPLSALAPSARGAAAIARAAERQRAEAVEEEKTLPAGAVAARSDEQRAAEHAFAKKEARRRAKRQKQRTSAAATEQTETSPPPQPPAQTPDPQASAPPPPSFPPPKPTVQQVAGFEDTNWGTADVGLLPENWTAHRDPTSRSFYYFNESICSVRSRFTVFSAKQSPANSYHVDVGQGR
jgi:hypothetical protein